MTPSLFSMYVGVSYAIIKIPEELTKKLTVAYEIMAIHLIFPTLLLCTELL